MAHILIIDDEESICYMLKQLLTLAGYQVMTVLDGKQALTLCNNTSFDLIITDIFMPELEGLEFIREIKKECSLVKIIAISGGSICIDVGYLDIAKLFGADISLSKPLDNEQLLATVKMLVPDVS